MNCKTFTSPVGRQICSQQRCYFFIFIFIYIYILFVCINCNIVAGTVCPLNSYLHQNWQHSQSVVFWAANEDKRTGVDTEKIATYAHPLQHKDMHKIRLNIVFILFRASQICGLCPQIYSFASVLSDFSRWTFFFVWSKCILLIVWWTSVLSRETVNLLRYSSIHWHLLTWISKARYTVYNAFRQGHCVPTGRIRCQPQRKDNHSCLQSPSISPWNSF